MTKSLLRALPPFAVLALAGGFCYWLFATKPEPRKWPRSERVPEVAVERLQPVDYQVWLKSQGTVQARTESTLIPEVRGRIMGVSESFRPGAFFAEGETLVQIDPRDYETEVVVAEAALAQAELRLAEEEAAAEQARTDWEQLQTGQSPSPLVLRVPQLRQARTNVASARARLETARVNRERCEIRAPYAGRILTKSVDVGQYVSPGNILARIYAVDFAEVRLPLSERQISFMELRNVMVEETARERANRPRVALTWELGNERYEWEGRIVRTEGAIDTNSRQLFVVAQIENPYRLQGDRLPLKVGSFVQARIEGKLLRDRFIIPRELYRKNEYILTVTEAGTLQRRPLDVEWSDEAVLVVKDGLEAGDRLCITPLNFPVNGMEVAVTEVDGVAIARAEGENERKGRSWGN